MKEIEIGRTFLLEKTIDVTDTAIAFGSGDVEVFATPSMIAQMEETALKMIAPLLNENQTTVGFEVCIKHLKAIRVGERVLSKATILEVVNQKIVFLVEVSHNKDVIGKGRHTRYIVDKDKFNS